MKKTILSFTAIGIIGIAYAYYTYTPKISVTSEVGVLIDITDSFVPQLTGEYVGDFLKIKQNRWNSYDIQIRQVSDVVHTPVTRINLAPCTFIPLAHHL